MKNRAFTLLELLVVITIIGILASIVVVSMSGSTDSATIAKGKAYAQQIHALLGHEAVLDLNFNENDYNTCPDGSDVCDASGYNNNGTISQDEDGAAFVSSPVDGYALSFDGVDDYVNAGNGASLNITGEITIEAWVNTDIESPAVNKGIFAKCDAVNGYMIRHRTGAKDIQAAVFKSGSAISADSSITLVAGQWYHVVGTYNGERVKVYVNGVYEGVSGVFTAGIGITAYNARIGNDYNTPNWSGLIDDVRIYAAALPATEIQKHYVQGLERLLSNQAITQAEYIQRMEEFNQSLASNRF
jgi:prepilin-type N-terminal cleavage/methylation domain-containing protein